MSSAGASLSGPAAAGPCSQRATASRVRSDGLKAALAKGARGRRRVLKQPNAPNGDTKALGAPAGSEGKESACSPRFNPCVGKTREDLLLGRSPGEVMRPTPVFLPGESHGRKSLAGCSHGVAKSRS